MASAAKKFEDLEVWKRGCRMAADIYKITENNKVGKDLSLRDQIRRSAVSIPSNIAEGFGRGSDAEFKRFLLIAKGSCAELKTQIYIAESISFIDKKISRTYLKECDEISLMITGLVNYLKTSLK